MKSQEFGSLRVQGCKKPGEADLGAGAHHATALGRPVGETAEIVAIFPDESEEFPGVEMGGFFAEEGFKTPLEIGAVPRMKAIAAGGHPVVAERLPHVGIVHERKMRPREKMVKKRRKACAEAAEDTENSGRERLKGGTLRTWGAASRVPTEANPGPTRKTVVWGTQTLEKKKPKHPKTRKKGPTQEHSQECATKR